MLKALWRDEFGGVISPEMGIVGAILLVGLFVGITALRTAVQTEIEDVGAAVESFDFTPELVPKDPMPATADPDDDALTASDVMGGATSP